MKTAILTILLNLCFLANASSDEQWTSADLAGKWEGTDVTVGGVLEINIEKTSKNEIVAHGTVRGSRARPTVFITVKEKIIDIETFFPNLKIRANYNCLWAEKDLLKCKSSDKDTEFKKVS
jgi:hypothetical protein